jgi:ABC-type amino acid transport substrate-binding protein
MRIVAQEGSLSAWQVAKDYGEDNLSTYPSLSGVFGELSSGSVSYAVVDAIVGSFLAIQYENIRCEGILKEPQGVYIGVASENQTLKDQVGNALIELRDGGKLRVIVAKWIGPVSAQAVLSTQGIISLSGTGETEVPADSTQTPPSTN